MSFTIVALIPPLLEQLLGCLLYRSGGFPDPGAEPEDDEDDNYEALRRRTWRWTIGTLLFALLVNTGEFFTIILDLATGHIVIFLYLNGDLGAIVAFQIIAPVAFAFAVLGSLIFLCCARTSATFSKRSKLVMGVLSLSALTNVGCTLTYLICGLRAQVQPHSTLLSTSSISLDAFLSCHLPCPFTSHPPRAGNGGRLLGL